MIIDEPIIQWEFLILIDWITREKNTILQRLMKSSVDEQYKSLILFKICETIKKCLKCAGKEILKQ